MLYYSLKNNNIFVDVISILAAIIIIPTSSIICRIFTTYSSEVNTKVKNTHHLIFIDTKVQCTEFEGPSCGYDWCYSN